MTLTYMYHSKHRSEYIIDNKKRPDFTCGFGRELFQC